MFFIRNICRSHPSRELNCRKLLLLAGSLLILICLGNKGVMSEIPEAQFLNDRASDIIGSQPLQVRGLAIPEGLTGRGQILGLADSGLDTGNLNDLHPDLQSVPGQMPKVVLLKSWSGREVPDDPVGHGTHMAATIAGTGAASDGQYKGIAPEASIYFQALLNEQASLEPPLYISELFYPAYSAGVRVHINGWGGGPNNYGSNPAQIDRFVRMYPDFLPIFAAGNSGPGKRTLTAEANSKNALVIGASQSMRPTLSPEALDTGLVTKFSSQGPTGDGRIKPDLVAPGSAIVSARSRLTDSNFAANPQYTLMEGSSMGAAVAGGAAGLLRQWFQAGEGVEDPSAALLKAALINGARRDTESPNSAQGFGVLDLCSTVLGLRENSFAFTDERAGVETGGLREYRFQLRQSGESFKATLVWSDPAVVAGSTSTLVNNLDLQVIDPKGNQYWGNFWLNGSDQTDILNNVEQVWIPEAVPGEYLVRVWGKEIKTPAALNEGEEKAQDFALVYGEPFAEGIVDQVLSDQQVVLANGQVTDLAEKQLQVVVNGQKKSSGDKLNGETEGLVGAQLYQTEQAAYLVSRIWQVGAIQLLPTDRGSLFMEIGPEQREGGYYYNTDSRQPILMNGLQVEELQDLPAGMQVSGTVNPVSQTLWQVAVGYIEKTGLVDRVDPDKQQIWLLQDSHPYPLDPDAVITINDWINDAGLLDTAFGGGDAAVSLEQIRPGMSVRLVLSPASGKVQYISVQRELVLGRLGEVDPRARQLQLLNGADFQVVAGTKIIRNQQEALLADLKPGDYLMAVIIPDSKEIIHTVAYSDVVFGQIVYLSAKQGTLYLADQQNQFNIFKLTEQTQVYRWGIQVEPEIVQPGTWVRLTTQPGSAEVWRMDVAQVTAIETVTLAEYDPQTRVLKFTDGTSYPLDPSALITKQGYLMEPRDLVPGESARISCLKSQSSEQAVLAAVEINDTPGVENPNLQVQAMKQENVVRIKGNTSADRLYLYRTGKDREQIPVGGEGDFVWYFEVSTGESAVQVVAVDSSQGGVSDFRIEISQISRYGFSDIEGHWAAAQINELTRRGVINGYPDGTYQPEQFINRSEIACILENLITWSDESDPVNDRLPLNDAEAIPGWAKNAVTIVEAQGLMQGYPDGTFKPQNRITRGELAVLAARMLEKSQEKRVEFGSLTSQSQRTPAADLDLWSIPAWCRPAVKQVGELGIMTGREAGRFEPEQMTTRAEVATVFYRMLAVLENPADE